MRPGERPPAQPPVDRHARGQHYLDRHGEFSVPQLADVEITVDPVRAGDAGPAPRYSHSGSRSAATGWTRPWTVQVPAHIPVPSSIKPPWQNVHSAPGKLPLTPSRSGGTTMINAPYQEL